ncbi:MAG: thiamine pyrophosphate-binding protein [Candidatus Lambdaproteobacteria bacterium]|nr:thiamine pyrophosphate-binding protein [Candidatus Lambdaproteobacteria bacterium]
MAELTGSEILARSLKNEGTKDLFFILGGPMQLAETSCLKEGIRPIDVRHEQAAALMAQAYSRLLQKPAVCMAASGPGVINLTTGIANALIDCAPVVAVGGSSSIGLFGRQTFQEIDQLAIMKTCTKWSDRIYNLKRIPEQVNNAFQHAMGGKPGPVYLDCPADLLYEKIPESAVDWSLSGRPLLAPRPMGNEQRIDELVGALAQAKQPIVLSGSGVIWSQAWDELRAFVEKAGVPFYTTPQGRGVLPDDHPQSYLAMRASAFRDADLILIVGTRMNFIIGHAAPPRFAAKAKIARIDIDAAEIASSPRKVDIGIVGDCKMVLQQMLERMGGKIEPERYAPWRKRLGDGEAAKRKEPSFTPPKAGEPIHPLQLCEEVKNFMRRDAILVVDGQEILNYGRQSMPTFTPGHRLNSGPFGMMGVGLPFGVGAKVAKPDKQVIVVHGDGSFGLNGMELDTAVRHKIPILVVISLNGGWTADPKHEKVGRNLGYTRYDKMAEGLGCYGEYVEKPEEIGPALRRAQKKVDQGMVALVNVKTDENARAGTVAFSSHST